MLDKLYAGRGSVTTQVFPATSAAYDASLDTMYDQDIERAKDLMAAAGYADGFDITMPTHVIFSQAELATVESSLAKIGVRVTWEDPGPGQFFSSLLGGNYAMTIMQLFQPSDWQIVGQLVATDAVWNVEGTMDDRFPVLIDTMQTGAQEEADAAAGEINRILVEEAWYIPWFRYQQTYVTTPGTTVQPQAEQAVPSIYNFAPTK